MAFCKLLLMKPAGSLLLLGLLHAEHAAREQLLVHDARVPRRALRARCSLHVIAGRKMFPASCGQHVPTVKQDG